MQLPLLPEGIPEPSVTFVFLFTALVFSCVTVLTFIVFRSYRHVTTEKRTCVIGLTAFVLLTILVATYIIAGSGILQRWDQKPPPMLILLLTFVALNSCIQLFTDFGKRIASLPLSIIVGFQVFRLPVEMLLALGHHEGFVPIQLTWEGRNWDVITAILALFLCGWALAIERIPWCADDVPDRREPPAWAFWTFNIVGLGLLINVVTTAVLSMPTQFRMFTNDPPAVFFTYPPFIWLPTILVQMALAGHLWVFRALLGCTYAEEHEKVDI